MLIFSNNEIEIADHYTQQNNGSEVEYYNLLPSTTSTSSVSQHKNGKHTLMQTTHSTLTPPPSPPSSDETQNNEQQINGKGQQQKGNETSVLIKEPRRPPRACDTTDTMLASAATSIHNYYNLITFENKSNDVFNPAPVTPPPPRLPKRKPFLVTQSRSQSPPASFSFGSKGNNGHASANDSENSYLSSPFTLEEDFQHQAVENGFSSNFAGSRVGIQGGPPPFRRMSTGSRGSFTSSATSATLFNHNIGNTHPPFNGNHHGQDRVSTCHPTQSKEPSFIATGGVASSTASNQVSNHSKPIHGCRNGNNTVLFPSFCNNNNNTKQARRLQLQSSSVNSSMRRSGRRSTGGSVCRCKTSKRSNLSLLQIFLIS